MERIKMINSIVMQAIRDAEKDTQGYFLRLWLKGFPTTLEGALVSYNVESIQIQDPTNKQLIYILCSEIAAIEIYH